MKSPKSRAILKADKEFSLYIRARDPICVLCGDPTSDCAHVFSRRFYATRWNEHNAYGLCKGCHYLFHNRSEADLIDLARHRIGNKKYEDMKMLSKTESHFKAYQIEEITRYYKQKREALTNGAK